MNPLAQMDALGREVWTHRKELAQPLWLMLGTFFGFGLLGTGAQVLMGPADPTAPNMTATAVALLILLISMPIQFFASCWLGLALSARLDGEAVPPLKDAIKGRYLGASLLSLAILAGSFVVGTLMLCVGMYATVPIAMGMGGLLLVATLRGHTVSQAVRIATQPTHIGIRWGVGPWKTYMLLGLAMSAFTYGLSSITQLTVFALGFLGAFQSGIGNPEAALGMSAKLQMAGLLSTPLTAAASTLTMAVTIGGLLWFVRLLDRQRDGAELDEMMARLEASR